MTASPCHIPVMLDEVASWLNPEPGMVIVDGTFGGGGHARALAQAVAPNGRVVAADLDPAAVEQAADRFRGLPIDLAHASYCDLPEVLDQLGVDEVDGVLLDLGLSSDQLADASRGFSFQGDGDLDLRFDPSCGQPAWALLQRMSERQIADALFHFGEERYSRRIARRIIERRRSGAVRTAGDLAQLVRSCVPRSPGRSIDPATRTFQALRILVNDELKNIETALTRLPPRIRPNRRIAVLSFHSLEDRIVKTNFRNNPLLDPITRRPIQPSAEELRRNPRARSAKLRVAVRVGR
ncbi:MAG: 16S rRNA (cytosine(1402)-N(4))-methyltransferase RsmH [Planctomycetota bacterium]